MKVQKVSKSGFRGTATKLRAGSPPPPTLSLPDNLDQPFTVGGLDSGSPPQPVDISGVATITVTSDNPAVMTADTPSGMSCTVHALTPGSVNLTIVATWNDGSVGPFTITWPITVTGSAATGLVITPGTPTVRG